ncbi:hypothetical protein [Xenorhabdus ishibashii]|uniref:Uncharacterized protein n=1 Tax=Xenorhabdus ishibashii TaxID=1034471 RepID=A0A2D0KDL7_9GAMM|nr:hypothetical protein [Xenorhabdus ishibashii]PHM61534.1 hypothetical protein Xish_00670 [Xenorhabdus ishibashii]
MNKNIIIVYGFSEHRKKYLIGMNNSSTHDIYITMDDLLFSLYILIPGGGNHISSINDFLQSDGKTRFLLEKNSNYLVDYFYSSVRDKCLISTQNPLDAKNLEHYLNKVKFKINKPTVEYLLRSLSVFFKSRLPQLSISATLNRRKENITKTGNYKEYKNYQAGFLAKNALNSKERNLNILKEKMNNQSNINSDNIDIATWNTNRSAFSSKNYPERSSREFIRGSFYGNYNIGNKAYTSQAFNAFIESDKKGFENILAMQNDIDERDNRYYRGEVTEQDREMFAHGDLMANCFSMAFIRKLSKQSIDWAEQEASKENSPIKKIIFYVEEHPTLDSKKINNINTKNLHHKWRNSNFTDIGSNSRNFPITYSELKYAIALMENKKDHHIELMTVDKFTDAKKVIDNL